MTESGPRKPASFRVKPDREPQRPARSGTGRTGPAPRKPRAVRETSKAVIVPATDDPFDLPDTVATPPTPSVASRRRSYLVRLFLASIGILVTLAIGLWADTLVRNLFARSDWLGWAALCAAGLATLCLLLIVIRELAALSRLGSVTRLRARAARAIADNDSKAARAVARDLVTLLASDPATAAGRKTLESVSGEVIDGSDLIGLAETELLRPLDTRARKLILESAKRVSVVTAVSPRALVDVGYVLFEAGRLIRRISELYGGRPGTAGFFRLAGRVASHLAVTGSIAVGDSLIQQVIGHGLAARLSSRLGEGVVNGLMTARIGVAAMDVVRPLPFARENRPGIGGFLSDLARFTGKPAESGGSEKK